MTGQRDGILERSRRYLSDRSLAIFHTTKNPPATTVFDGVPTQDKTPSQRRQAQVRRAQKSYREREKQYITALESEIVELRAKHTQQTDELVKEIQSLRQVLAENGFAAPSSPGQPQVPMVTVTRRTEGKSRKHLQVLFPSTENDHFHKSPSAPLDSDLIMQTNGIDNDAMNFEPSPHPTTSVHGSHAHSHSPAAQMTLDEQQRGINFILSLEHPCMNHPNLLASSGIGSGHAQLMSASILSSAPTPAVNPIADTLLPDPTWQTPVPDLDSLLACSLKIHLDGEMTPVQVWHRLQSQAAFLAFDETGLELFRRTIADAVRCYGFGAVVDEDVFEAAVDGLLGRLVGQNGG